MERETYPSEPALAAAREEQASLRHHGPQPGRVQSYDATTQTADIVPLIRQQVPQPDGSYTFAEMPVVPSVPVIFLRVPGWFFALKVEPGTEGVILPMGSAIGHWRIGDGSVCDPGDLRRHHIQSSVFIPGLTTRSKALAHAPTGDDALVMGADAPGGTRVAMLTNGTLRVTQGTATVLEIDAAGVVHLGGAAGELVALANLVTSQLTALKSAINGAAIAPGDGGATFKANIMAALASWPGGVAATKTKAT